MARESDRDASSDARPRSVVAVENTAQGVRDAIARALDAIAWKDVVPAGADVSLKVNLGWDLFIPGSITSPLVVESLIEVIRPHVGKIYVIEADQVLENIERAFTASGMAGVCSRTGARWLNTTSERTVPVYCPENTVLTRIDVPWVLRESKLITVPVMKTHAKTGITGALKNQWGCLSTLRHEHHLVLDDALADLNSVIRPALALMDGTVGLEGNGPKSGRPRIADRVLCSTDAVALDTLQASMMGIDPDTIRHLALCAARGIGTNLLDQIEVRSSAPIAPLAPFVHAHHNAVSQLETLLRRSLLKKLVFNTPLFQVPLVGAKAYYRTWAWLRAAECWKMVEAHPIYGPQWRRVARPWPTRARTAQESGAR